MKYVSYDGGGEQSSLIGAECILLHEILYKPVQLALTSESL